jgi:hypothetical protein
MRGDSQGIGISSCKLVKKFIVEEFCPVEPFCPALSSEMADGETLRLIEHHLSFGSQDEESSAFLTELIRENPFGFLHDCSRIILSDPEQRAVTMAVILMKTILRPGLSRPLPLLRELYHSLDPGQRNEVKEAFFKALMYNDIQIINNGAHGVALLASFEYGPYSTCEWPDLYEQLGELYTESLRGAYSPIGALITMREVLKLRLLARRNSPAFSTSRDIVLKASCDILSMFDAPHEVRLEAAQTLRIAIRRFIEGPIECCGMIIDALMQSLDSTGALHQTVCLALGKLMMLIRPALTHMPEFRDTLIRLTQESLGGPNVANYIALWDKFATGEALHRDSFCVVPDVAAALDAVFLPCLGSDASDGAESDWSISLSVFHLLVKFGQIAPDVVFRDCLAELRGVSTVHDLLVLQIATRMQTEDAAALFVNTFPDLLNVFRSSDVDLRLSAMAVADSWIRHQSSVHSDDHYRAVLTAAWDCTADPAMVKRSTVLIRRVLSAIAGSPLVLTASEPLLNLLGELACRDEAIEDAYWTLGHIFTVYPSSHLNDLRLIIETLGQHFEVAISSDDARRRTAIAAAVSDVCQRFGAAFREYACPFLDLLRQAWSIEDPDPYVLQAMAAIANIIDVGVDDARPLLEVGFTALTNGNNTVIAPAARLIANAIRGNHGGFLGELGELLAVGWTMLQNYEQDEAIVAALVIMIREILSPREQDRGNVAGAIFDIREELMRLLQGVALGLRRMGRDIEAREHAFIALLGAYAGVARLYRHEQQEVARGKFVPGEFLAAHALEFLSLPGYGYELQILSTAVLNAFLLFLYDIVCAFGQANNFNLKIRHRPFREYLERAKSSEDREVRKLYQHVKWVYDKA